MPPPPRTARGARTREALWQAAQVRFLAQGVAATSAEQIAADAGVSLRTFYRHFASKHELLFGDYDASLRWFRAALAARPPDESVTEAVLASIHSFPYDHDAVFAVAALRDRALDPGEAARHLQQVQADFAAEVEQHLLARGDRLAEDPFEAAVCARCIAAATFAAVETWMGGDHADLDELSQLTERALRLVTGGLPVARRRGRTRRNGKIAETAADR